MCANSFLSHLKAINKSQEKIGKVEKKIYQQQH